MRVFAKVWLTLMFILATFLVVLTIMYAIDHEATLFGIRISSNPPSEAYATLLSSIVINGSATAFLYYVLKKTK